MPDNRTTPHRVSGYSLKNNEIVFANIRILLLLFIGALLVYRFDFPFSNTIYYSLVFVLFLRSKNNVFWVAFLFILISNPLGLFYYKPYDWMLSVTNTIGIPYTSIFGIIFFLKAKYVLKTEIVKLHDYLKPYYKVFGLYVLFLLVLSFVFGHSMASIYRIIISLSSFLLFYSLPRFFRYKELVHLNRILFLFVIIHSFLIFYDIIFQGQFIKFITFGKSFTGAAFTESIIRILGGMGLNLYVIVIAIFYIFRNESAFKKWYLWLVIILAYLAILASATRGWMIASTFFLVATLLSALFGKGINFKSVTALFVIAAIVIILIPQGLNNNLTSAFVRLSTVESIAEGDLTAEGTAIRLTERGPRALKRFNESPVFGFGYSQVTEEYYDGHVGNHSLLIMGGIVGMAIVYFTVIFIIFFLFRASNKHSGKGLYYFGLALISIMIIHSTSRAMVSFYFPADSAFIIAMFCNHVNATLQKNLPTIIYR